MIQWDRGGRNWRSRPFWFGPIPRLAVLLDLKEEVAMNRTMESSDSDADGLFARARAGDQAAWEELFTTCYPKVVRVVRRKLNAPMRSLYDSTDFASDVWGSLVAKSDRFDFPNVAALMAFLTKAAEQKVI